MEHTDIIIAVPKWLTAYEADQTRTFPTIESRINLAVELSQRNINENTGGPFGAAIFDLNTHTLVAAGVNLVTSAVCSIAHAEMVAIARAQHKLNTWNMAAAGRFELASSCAPCAMCLGALPWSGISSLVCAARDRDARSIGFDEGAKPADWSAELQNRGIAVAQDILRENAVAVLRAYAAAGGTLY